MLKYKFKLHLKHCLMCNNKFFNDNPMVNYCGGYCYLKSSDDSFTDDNLNFNNSIIINPINPIKLDNINSVIM